jgi:hypothetical protein
MAPEDVVALDDARWCAWMAQEARGRADATPASGRARHLADADRYDRLGGLADATVIATPALAALAKFGALVLSYMLDHEMCGPDEADPQEFAVAAGALVVERRAIPCGPSCGCAEYYGSEDAVADCCRPPADVSALLARLTAPLTLPAGGPDRGS